MQRQGQKSSFSGDEETPGALGGVEVLGVLGKPILRAHMMFVMPRLLERAQEQVSGGFTAQGIVPLCGYIVINFGID